MSTAENRLAQAHSPYLLQHAHNPVHWQMWDEATLQAAAENDRLIIVSIGYASCHWCHVMEREVFEDPEAAAVMNADFISIKVDREEQPDVDQVYMSALQLMSGQGGWPLNVVCLPDGRPIWGGTYVPKEQWMKALTELVRLYREEREKVEEYAQKLQSGVQKSQMISLSEEEVQFTVAQADQIYRQWQPQLDFEEGGAARAPKFPMPTNLRYLLHYSELAQHQEAANYLHLSLRKMALGGIYDQIGGGFSRYSVDSFWKVPHFEKMLYDNAQLLQVYAEAYQARPQPLYATVIRQTIAWLDREMASAEGAYYSGLDADSEGEEGKFYVWEQAELRSLIPTAEWQWFSDFYQVNSRGHWEQGRYILLRRELRSEFAQRQGLEAEAFERMLSGWQERLLTARSQRERPSLDDKALTSWNALLISGFTAAYRALGDAEYLQKARGIAQWILREQRQSDGRLHHAWRAGHSHVQGLIEDYAFSAQAFLDLYEAEGRDADLRQAAEWVALAKSHFEDKASGFFYTRDLQRQALIARSQESADNVIPAANSVMAHNLFRLSHHLERPAYRAQADQMLGHLLPSCLQYGESYSNWGRLLLHRSYPFFELAICGASAQKLKADLDAQYLPHCLFALSLQASERPLLKERYQPDQSLIYVCQERSCLRPTSQVSEALQQVRLEKN